MENKEKIKDLSFTREGRKAYEHLELDYDGFRYWFHNSDMWYTKRIKGLEDFYEFWSKTEHYGKPPYYKGTALYFTYKGKKDYVTWTFYSARRMNKAIKLLKELGATNIQINEGEID